MNFEKFLKTPFLQNTSGRLLLEPDTFTNSYNELLMNVFAVRVQVYTFFLEKGTLSEDTIRLFLLQIGKFVRFVWWKFIKRLAIM